MDLGLVDHQAGRKEQERAGLAAGPPASRSETVGPRHLAVTTSPAVGVQAER